MTWDQFIPLIDWIPDTIMDSVAVMLALYSVVMIAVFEFMCWLDRRRNRKEEV